MGFLADNCTFRLLTRELIATCKPFSYGYDDLDEYFLQDSPLWADQMYGKTYCFTLKDDPQTIVCAFSLSNETIRSTIPAHSTATKRTASHSSSRTTSKRPPVPR